MLNFLKRLSGKKNEKPSRFIEALLVSILFLCIIAPGANTEGQEVKAQLPPDVGALCLKVIDAFRANAS
jgi:hypothetical protein